MPILNEEEFSKHLGTKFYATLGDREVDLTLAEITGYNEAGQPAGMERFSLYFDGPPDSVLPQGVFPLRHDKMGELEIFLVPVSGDEKGFRYEAVFNFYK